MKAVTGMSLSTIKGFVEKELDQTKTLIHDKLESQIPLAQDITDYIIESGGKRIRPLLVLLIAKALQHDTFDQIKLAAIIEMMHTATLLHDDVIDDSQLRRGRKTVNAEWGNEASVLVGDLLYARTFQMLTEIGNLSVMDLIANATSYIIEGEILQLMHRMDPETSEQTYLDIIQRKTGCLFATATSCIAVLINQPSETVTSLKQFGEYLGMAFQMVDDALDYEGDSDITGKNIGDDFAEGKPTLPIIYLLQYGNDHKRQLITQAFDNPETAQIQSITQALHQSEAITYTKQLAQYYANCALSCLECLPESEAKTALQQLTQEAVNRRS